MASCTICKSKDLQWSCSSCERYAYCSEECADAHWYDNQHYKQCGVLIDDVPVEVLLEILYHVPVTQLNGACRTNRRNAELCKDEHFQREYVKRRPLTEWTSALLLWFRSQNRTALYMWMPLLLGVWNPAVALWPLFANAHGAKVFAFESACRLGYQELVRLLLADGRVNPARYHNMPLMLACSKGHIGVVMMLLTDARVNPNDEINDGGERVTTAISCAARYNQHEVLRALLADGRADPSGRQDRAIYIACAEGHFECAKLLLADPRVNPVDPDDDTDARFPPLSIACKRGHVRIVNLLMNDPRVKEAVIEPDTEEDILQDSIDNNQVAVVECLLQSDAIDPREYGNLPMVVACATDKVKIVQLFLRLHFDLTNPFIENCHELGTTAFSGACARGSHRVVRLLLDDPRNPIDNREFFRVIAVVVHGREIDPAQRRIAFQMLLDDQRYDPSYDNQLALLTAVQQPVQRSGIVAYVEALLQHPKVGTADGLQKALEAAQSFNKPEIVKLIQSKQRVVDESLRKQRRLVERRNF